jgi:hypothetical protein
MDCSGCSLAGMDLAPLECWLCALMRTPTARGKRELGHAMLDDWIQSVRAGRVIGIDLAAADDQPWAG